MGLLPEETTLEKTRALQPSWQHCFQEPNHGSNQQGNRHRPGQHDVVQTYKGKAQAIQTKGKNATGSDKEGPSEDPKKQSQSDRERPISYGIPSRMKLKTQSHRLTEKRDTDSHSENPLGVPTTETSEGNPSGVCIDTLTYGYKNRPP